MSYDVLGFFPALLIINTFKIASLRFLDFEVHCRSYNIKMAIKVSVSCFFKRQTMHVKYVTIWRQFRDKTNGYNI